MIPTSAALLLATFLTLKTLNVYPFAREDKLGYRHVYKLGKVKMTNEIKEERTVYDDLQKLQFWEAKMSVNGKSNGNNNFVFIKCMKCATETVGNILRRYAFTRNLNVVLPRSDNIYLGWPVSFGDSRLQGFWRQVQLSNRTLRLQQFNHETTLQ